MAFSRDDSLTAVKVRGKRRGLSSEKWSAGKRRETQLQKRPAESPGLTSVRNMSKRKRRQKMHENDSPLECLPVEVLQQVFEYSVNIELPLVSRELASKLSKSTHLRYQLTSQLLRPVLGHANASPKELGSATRLLNSKFMTWSFFISWLRNESIPSRPTRARAPAWDVVQARKVWLALKPSPLLLPPKKLLCSPFNQEKEQFLAVLSCNIEDLGAINAAYGELGSEGLTDAIRQNRPETVLLLLSMGLCISTQTLRVAVTEAGCDEKMVRTLVDYAVDSGSVRRVDGAVDLLDPVVWAWADEATRNGNETGTWLVEYLRNAQHRKSQMSVSDAA